MKNIALKNWVFLCCLRGFVTMETYSNGTCAFHSNARTHLFNNLFVYEKGLPRESGGS